MAAFVVTVRMSGWAVENVKKEFRLFLLGEEFFQQLS